MSERLFHLLGEHREISQNLLEASASVVAMSENLSEEQHLKALDFYSRMEVLHKEVEERYWRLFLRQAKENFR